MVEVYVRWIGTLGLAGVGANWIEQYNAQHMYTYK